MQTGAPAVRVETAFAGALAGALEAMRAAHLTRRDGSAPAHDSDDPVFELVGSILHLTDDAAAADCMSALLAGDAAADAAVPAVAAAADDALEHCMEIAGMLQDQELWPALAVYGPLLGRLAWVLGRTYDAAVGFVHGGRGAYRSQRVGDSVDNYSVAITIARLLDPLPRTLLSTCHDNRGMALQTLGRIDEALDDFRAAEGFEDDPATRTFVANQIANALMEIGYHDAGIRRLERNLAESTELAAGGAMAVGIARDNLAHAKAAAGDVDGAAALFEAARLELAGAPPREQYINALNRAGIHAERKDTGAASAAFIEALELAAGIVHATLGIDRARAAMTEAVTSLAAVDHPVWQLQAQAREASARERWEEALEKYQAAAEAADRSGDTLTSLSCRASMGGILVERGRGGDAEDFLTAVRRSALDRGFPAVVALTDVALSAMLRRGVERNDVALDPLFLSVEADVLGEMTYLLADEIPDASDRIPLLDRGVALARLGHFASEYNADEMSVRFQAEGVRWARHAGSVRGEINRLAGYLSAIDAVRASSSADPDTAVRMTDAAAEALERLHELRAGDLTLQQRVQTLATLGFHAERTAVGSGRDALREAVQLVDRLRADSRAAAGSTEPDVDLDAALSVSRGLVDSLLSSAGEATEIFTLLQRTRARGLLEQVARRAGTPYDPPGGEEALALVAAIPTPTTFVDIVDADGSLHALLVDDEGIRRVSVTAPTVDLHSAQYGDVRRRAADVAHLALTSPALTALAVAIDAAVAPGRAVLVAVDDGLANIPFHAVHLDGVPWATARAVSRIPAVGMLRYSRPRTWSGQSVVAGDSAGDLPGAAAEIGDVAHLLGTAALHGPDCTLDAVEAALEGDIDVVHLAVHGRADARRGGRSSLLFASEPRARWASFDELAAMPWRAALIVFSGCSTAVGGPRDGSGLYGIAQSAAAAGALATIASLWPVDDVAARVYMTAFYRALIDATNARPEYVDLRAPMETARRAVVSWHTERAPAEVLVRDGRDLVWDEEDRSREPAPDVRALLDWAPFVLIGDPILRVR